MNLVKLSGMEVVAYPYSRAELCQDYPNVSFPKNLTEDVLSHYSVAIVHPFPMPQGTETHRFVEGQPEFINGRWQQSWVMVERELPTETGYPRFTPLEMLDLFTEAEQLAIVGATMSVPEVKLWYDRMLAATFISYEDPRTKDGLQALVDAGLIGPDRKDAIVAAMQPSQGETA